MSRKNFYKVIFTTADELFFFSFSHMPNPFPPPHKERTLNVCVQVPELQHSIGPVGGRENSKIFLKTLHCFMREPRNYSYFIFFIFYFISFAKNNKQTNKQTYRTLAWTPQQLWPITAGPDTNKK